MASDPTADAFVQAILRDPSEVTGKLAFADWLQDQGGVPNLAWAFYIRLHLEIAECEAKGKKCGNLHHEAEGHARYIQGEVTVPASLIFATHDAILRVVPVSRCTVSLNDWTIPRSLYERVPIAVGGFAVVPLSCRGHTVVVATADPEHARLLEMAREHDVEITALRADEEDLANVLRNVIPDRN